MKNIQFVVNSFYKKRHFFTFFWPNWHADFNFFYIKIGQFIFFLHFATTTRCNFKFRKIYPPYCTRFTADISEAIFALLYDSVCGHQSIFVLYRLKVKRAGTLLEKLSDAANS